MDKGKNGREIEQKKTSMGMRGQLKSVEVERIVVVS
jgi:hypothetical protein